MPASLFMAQSTRLFHALASQEYFKDRLLFIYTDGLNEAENNQQEQFGDERILELLRQAPNASAEQIIETLADAVSQHRNGAEPNDDLTMMCIHVRRSISYACQQGQASSLS